MSSGAIPCQIQKNSEKIMALIGLRSDTVTRPSKETLTYMMRAECALQNNVAQVTQDHENMHYFATQLATINEIDAFIENLQTNILFTHIKKNQEALREHLLKKDIIILPQNKWGFSRFVTHLDVSKDDCNTVIKEIKKFYRDA